ncbi:ABC transporter ATP-binding protein [Anaerocolumna sp. AGMB13020]|uniref:ABC transporter ATP-binding protein n=1 Tax=Anaerocolumna sp. AGMB13020 TaxID=3081750 RepID=UPI002954A042|nr:ABC transporter ATP-binding protein [Anaerocolumna sp. AGMB13020]WOO37670.1 ABC transporter ATP-binding protein [Anaerocolumna sp. AGMB13020]
MIKVTNLNFSYTQTPFIENVNFNVSKGEIFGFLGPSGAGKSTLQKILTGLLTGYKGTATVGGVEVSHHTNTFYENIGVDFEFPSLYEKLTARQNLEFFGSLYSRELRSIEELFEMVNLTNDGDKKVDDYSKGMKSRLNFIKALLHNPEIIFLDEPTSGLDPSNSYDMKKIIKAERAKGKAIILTTHNMQDAAELCDRVAFIVDGKMKALDTPHNLIMSKGANKLQYSYFENGEQLGECLMSASGEDKLLQRLVSENKLLSIHSSEPTLNDIFREVTGRVLE